MKIPLLLIALIISAPMAYSDTSGFSTESIEGFNQTQPEAPQQAEERQPKASLEEMATYRAAMHESVMGNFAKSEQFKGKECEVRVHFDENGKLPFENQSIRIIKGDSKLCSTAWKAITGAKLPKPQSLDVHNEFKTIFFYFHSNDFVMKNFNEYKGSLWSVLG